MVMGLLSSRARLLDPGGRGAPSQRREGTVGTVIATVVVPGRGTVTVTVVPGVVVTVRGGAGTVAVVVATGVVIGRVVPVGAVTVGVVTVGVVTVGVVTVGVVTLGVVTVGVVTLGVVVGVVTLGVVTVGVVTLGVVVGVVTLGVVTLGVVTVDAVTAAVVVAPRTTVVVTEARVVGTAGAVVTATVAPGPVTATRGLVTPAGVLIVARVVGTVLRGNVTAVPVVAGLETVAVGPAARAVVGDGAGGGSELGAGTGLADPSGDELSAAGVAGGAPATATGGASSMPTEAVGSFPPVPDSAASTRTDCNLCASACSEPGPEAALAEGRPAASSPAPRVPFRSAWLSPPPEADGVPALTPLVVEAGAPCGSGERLSCVAPP